MWPPAPNHPWGPEIGPCTDPWCIYCRVTIMSDRQLEDGLAQAHDELEAERRKSAELRQQLAETELERARLSVALAEKIDAMSLLEIRFKQVSPTLDMVRLGYER